MENPMCLRLLHLENPMCLQLNHNKQEMEKPKSLLLLVCQENPMCLWLYPYLWGMEKPKSFLLLCWENPMCLQHAYNNPKSGETHAPPVPLWHLTWNKPNACSILVHDWQYCSHKKSSNTIITTGKSNFIIANTCPDISCAAIHIYTKFSNQPHFLHEKVVNHIGCYLQNSRAYLWPKPNHLPNAYIDANFDGHLHHAYSHLHDSTLIPRTRHVFIYSHYPWK